MVQERHPLTKAFKSEITHNFTVLNYPYFYDVSAGYLLFTENRINQTRRYDTIRYNDVY